jgi:CheY-like chemotaxis protein
MGFPGEQPTVLLAEDHELVRGVMAEILRRAGYTVVEAADGEEAWLSLKHERPRVVITDLRMPRCDGRELCRRLRAEPSTAGIPVIIVTASPQEAAQIDRSTVLTKPVTPQALLICVEQTLGAAAASLGVPGSPGPALGPSCCPG